LQVFYELFHFGVSFPWYANLEVIFKFVKFEHLAKLPILHKEDAKFISPRHLKVGSYVASMHCIAVNNILFFPQKILVKGAIFILSQNILHSIDNIF
jgi:hypothetical protein